MSDAYALYSTEMFTRMHRPKLPFTSRYMVLQKSYAIDLWHGGTVVGLADALHPEGRRFESHSSHHVGT